MGRVLTYKIHQIRRQSIWHDGGKLEYDLLSAVRDLSEVKISALTFDAYPATEPTQQQRLTSAMYLSAPLVHPIDETTVLTIEQ